MDPARWKVLADFFWGEEGAFGSRPVIGFNYDGADAEAEAPAPE
jgi:hypothetical protein